MTGSPHSPRPLPALFPPRPLPSPPPPLTQAPPPFGLRAPIRCRPRLICILPAAPGPPSLSSARGAAEQRAHWWSAAASSRFLPSHWLPASVSHGRAPPPGVSLPGAAPPAAFSGGFRGGRSSGGWQLLSHNRHRSSASIARRAAGGGGRRSGNDSPIARKASGPFPARPSGAFSAGRRRGGHRLSRGGNAGRGRPRGRVPPPGTFPRFSRVHPEARSGRCFPAPAGQRRGSSGGSRLACPEPSSPILWGYFFHFPALRG